MPSSGPDWTVDMAQATALVHFAVWKKLNVWVLLTSLWGTLWHVCFLPGKPWNRGLSGHSSVGAGIHAGTVWPGGQGSAQQDGTYLARQDLSGLL